MAEIKGKIGVTTENIFPVIKQFLYSDHEIFLRELVANAVDATEKMKALASSGDFKGELGELAVRIELDEKDKVLKIIDRGIGMTEEEIDKYINQIAFSSAGEFLEKYKDQIGNIIGHFGLGFYSAFMVSKKVTIESLSWKDGAKAVKWSCDGSPEYEMSASDKADRGTCITLYLDDDSSEYAAKGKIEQLLNKYCKFMPFPIIFGKEQEWKDGKYVDTDKDKVINTVEPLWTRKPSELKDEDYKNFYRALYPTYEDPLFYIHINADYPLNFKGILFFPKYNNEYESLEGQVKLFYNQVFVADNIKEVIPEYLLMLKGVLDCPELPLNVSRSYLQNNTYVQKVGAHIVKKVADKLASMCNTDREAYEKVWDDIHIFVEFACIRDQKFYDRVKPALLLRLTDKKFATIDEYLEHAKEKHENTVYYATDVTLQAQYISMFESLGVEVAVFDKPFETQYISTLERYNQNVKFVRIDSDIADILKAEEQAVTDEAMQEKLTALFRKVSANEKLTVKLNSLKANKVPAILTVSEDSRRMDEFMKMYARAGINPGADSYPLEYTLSLNTSAPIIGNLEALLDTDTERAELIAGYIYKLTLLANRKLTPEEMQAFMSESFDILEKL